MPVTIQRKKVKPAVKPETKSKSKAAQDNQQGTVSDYSKFTLEELADEYGSVADRCRAIMKAAVFSHLALVTQELNTRLEEELPDAEDTAELTGLYWLLEIAARNKKPRKVINPLKVKDFVGEETFAKIISIKLGDLDKYLSPDELKLVVEESKEYHDKRTIAVKYIGPDKD